MKQKKEINIRTGDNIKKNLLITMVFISIYFVVIYIGVKFKSVMVESDVAMLFLLLNICTVYIFSAVTTSIITLLSIMAFHYFIIPEYNSFMLTETKHIITFVVMVFSGVFAIKITQSQKKEIQKTTFLKKMHEANYQLAVRLASCNDSQSIAQASLNFLDKNNQLHGQIWLIRETIQLVSSHKSLRDKDYRPIVLKHKKSKANKIDVSASMTLFPLIDGDNTFGFLLLKNKGGEPIISIILPLLTLSLARAEVNVNLVRAKRLNDLEGMRNTLLASVSHDLKTPLGSIIGSSTTLTDKTISLPQAVQQELLESIANEGYSLNRSLSKLLDITRYTSDKLIPKTDWFDPEEIIGSALKRVEIIINKHSFRIDIPPMLIEVDSALLEHVFANLVENAAKYSDVGTQIDIDANYDKGMFTLTIKDRGIGIPDESIPYIFGRFYRVGNSTKKGTGLGLAICKVIVSAHFGDITVAHREGGGTVFTVQIPCGKLEVGDLYEQ
ncbi:sensor histidine kinase [Photobacterium profundum]|uniref:sensor histidine kinase n=1 Tax=Photobacterium profundum TaxID=74109 RepID=UPI003D0D8DCD